MAQNGDIGKMTDLCFDAITKVNDIDKGRGYGLELILGEHPK